MTLNSTVKHLICINIFVMTEEERKEKNRERERRWRENNKERVRFLGRRWREENKEWSKEMCRKSREKNIERYKEVSKLYRSNNREICAERSRKWRSENKERAAEHQALRMERVSQSTPTWLTDEHKQQIVFFYNERDILNQIEGITDCYHPDFWTVDHIIPIKGKRMRGLHVPWNLQLMRRGDNISKTNTHT